MTLRELFASIVDWWDRSIETVRLSIWTVQNVSPMDWPLWLFPVVGVLAYVAIRIVIAIVTALFSKHNDGGKQKWGWRIALEGLLEPFGFVVMYATIVGLILAAGMSLVLLIGGSPIMSRWWGLFGLVIVITVFLAAAKAFRALARRGRAVMAEEAKKSAK